MFPDRTGLIVWVNDTKAARNLDRYGHIHFISKKLHYVVMYIHTERYDDTVKALQRLPYVKKIEKSYRSEIPTEYSSNVPDKTRFYTY